MPRKRNQVRPEIRNVALKRGKQPAPIGKTRAPRYENLTARQKATRERALELLLELRHRKGSYSKAVAEASP